jgi:tRNA G10  N-methylase Trm11
MIKLKDILTEAKIKTIDIWFEDSRGRFYRTVVNGKKRVKGWDSWRNAQESLSKLLGWEIYLRSMDDRELEKAAKQLKKQGIKLTWDDVMDVS